MSWSTSLAELVDYSKFKNVGHPRRGGVPMRIIYYIVTKCLIVKKNVMKILMNSSFKSEKVKRVIYQSSFIDKYI